MAEDGVGQSRFLHLARGRETPHIAIWVGKLIAAQGYTTFIQDQDFGNADFMARMADGFAMVDRGARVVALLSPHYLKKRLLPQGGAATR